MITPDQIGVYSQSTIDSAQPRTQEPAALSQHSDAEINVNQQYPTPEIANTESQVENNVTDGRSIALINGQRLSQGQLISANNEVNLDESVLLLDNTQDEVLLTDHQVCRSGKNRQKEYS